MIVTKSGVLSHGRGALIVPSRKPGFNVSHIAARGISAGSGISAVSYGGTFVSMLTGKAFTVAGTPSAKMLSYLGPCVNFTGATDVCSIASQSTASVSKITFAAIFILDSVGSTQVAVSNRVGSGTSLFVNSSGQPVVFGSSSVTATSITLSAGVPYFVAASFESGASANFIAVDLRTGKAIPQTVSTAATITQSVGTYGIGNGNGTSQQLKGSISHAMIGFSFLSSSELSAWGANPFGFWYP